jgi:hypothetical protein
VLSLFFSRRIQHKVVQEVYQGRDAGLFQEFNRLPGDGRIGAHRDAKYYAATAQKSSAAIVKALSFDIAKLSAPIRCQASNSQWKFSKSTA